MLSDTDLGKVLLHPSFGQLPQWAVVGDTFPVGCAFDESNVHYKVSYLLSYSWPVTARRGINQFIH